MPTIDLSNLDPAFIFTLTIASSAFLVLLVAAILISKAAKRSTQHAARGRF